MTTSSHIQISTCPDCDQVHIRMLDDAGDRLAETVLTPDAATQLALGLVQCAAAISPEIAARLNGETLGLADIECIGRA